MPLQNRVTPWGSLEAVAVRYSVDTVAFGNRGPLHNDQQRVIKPWHSKAWLACRYHVTRTRKVQRDDNRAFNGRKRVVMRPGFYTELFFLDQLTATAAGHRPCACCRRADFASFRLAWMRAHGGEWSAGSIDDVLHRERQASRGTASQPPRSPTLSSMRETLTAMPDGTFVSLSGRDADTRDAWLCWRGQLLRWTHQGYRDRMPMSSIDGTREVILLTPHSMVAAMRCGFVPGEVHESAHALIDAVPGVSTDDKAVEKC